MQGEKEENSEILNVQDFGAVGKGTIKETAQLQKIIDQGAKEKKPVYFPKGVYLTGALFLKTDSQIIFAKGATLLGTTELTDFPEIPNRVAGVEMAWPAAVLNAINVRNVKLSGEGIIDCQGPYWWDLYWGADQKGGLRAEYDQKGLRWIADYAIKRIRAALIYQSENVQIRDLTFRQSGFWNLQITYSTDILVEGIKVKDNNGPSTDGIDIDSSTNVRITQCELSCGDDCIVVKSGRDGDGWRVGKPSKNVEIDHCQIKSGYGITIGSEVSGGISDIYIHDMAFLNTDCGFRIKSSDDRGGYIRNIQVERLSMENVHFPFSWVTSWHKAYNTKLYTNIEKLPKAWQAVAQQLPASKKFTNISNIKVKDVHAFSSKGASFKSRAFDIVIAPQKPLQEVVFIDCDIQASEWGRISGVEKLKFENVIISAEALNSRANDEFDAR